MIILFCKGYKIHDILVPITGIGKHHPNAAGDRFLFFVIDRDELETAAVKRPVGAEEKADAKSIFYHLDRDIRISVSYTHLDVYKRQLVSSWVKYPL